MVIKEKQLTPLKQCLLSYLYMPNINQRANLPWPLHQIKSPLQVLNNCENPVYLSDFLASKKLT